ncbi:Asp-tRNA(Asn)/Glu-tRNA(Gln) amidotransferase subunit GatC [Wolbachia endosymbiont (group E) of Neria commutata]|uniref:Asp-tRNA(Asn)/Glu-tRNA(Gln) amidotransferase subunit GatC n=1 Tax=Wolbachia endosymbiont (group E) of Neria commutata TaxID=3066149 RepID=UPI003132C7C7
MPTKSTEDIITSLIEFVNKRKITITKEEMLKIAQLVRIKLSNDEIEYYSKELTMLDWIHDILLKVNTEGVFPIRYGSIDEDVHIRRDDVVGSQNIKEEILSNTKPEHGYFVVPKAISD